MIYEWLKIIHVISSAILFGTGMGTAFYMLYVNYQNNLELIANATRQVVIADWLFTGSSGVIQAITGLAMVYLKGYAITSLWIIGSIFGYLIALICWLPVVWLQIKCRDLAYQALTTSTQLSSLYYRYFKIWLLLGIPAFIALVGVFFLMANRPEWVQLYQLTLILSGYYT